ncbi:MAG: tyrosine-type recombinase/integrase [Planctomycetota bacterium]|jgi:integrase
MATVNNRPRGHKWIQFKGLAGRRHTIRLGKASKTQARDFRHRVERLLAAKAMGQPADLETARWAGSLSTHLHARLAATGLVDRRFGSTLADLVRDFEGTFAGKPNSLGNLRIAAHALHRHFGPDRDVSTITAADAKTFRAWMATAGGRQGGPLAPSTVSRQTGRAKQILEHAVRRQWIHRNPFDAEKRANESNRARDFFVTPEVFGRILDQVADLEFRAILLLIRIGGARCPSEVTPLRWDAVNWDRNEVCIGSPKTEHHPGQDHRFVPLFPELRQALDQLWAAAAEGAELLFPRHQVKSNALKKKLAASCRRAGVQLWRKPFTNMRATRVSEINDHFPAMVAAAWLGHSPAVARRHYYQLAKEHAARAAGLDTLPGFTTANPTQNPTHPQRSSGHQADSL